MTRYAEKTTVTMLPCGHTAADLVEGPGEPFCCDPCEEAAILTTEQYDETKCGDLRETDPDARLWYPSREPRPG